MRHLSGKEYKDLKELAWDVYGQESYEAETALRYEMETMEQCTWPEPEGDSHEDSQNQKEVV
jgi:hypothetical protein